MRKIKLTEKENKVWDKTILQRAVNKVYGKKHNNESSLVQQWTTQKLKSTYLSCMSAINSDCFASHDVADAEACKAELEARGYTIHEGTHTITKE